MFESIDLSESRAEIRILAVVITLLVVYLSVRILKYLSTQILKLEYLRQHSKFRSVIGLIASVLIFTIYFTGIGYCLHATGISIKAYFASATVIGLAVGFGSQGVVQDIVTGLTLVFSDLIDIDDLVEISGQTGKVKFIGMRFVILENPLGAQVFIPNRTIGNVISYPKGYLRCLVDVTLPDEDKERAEIIRIAKEKMKNASEQFPGILIAPPSTEGIFKTTHEKQYIRLKFRIWPNRGAPLETAFKQELVQAIQSVKPDYADWMVTVFYETERPVTIYGAKREQNKPTKST